MAEIAEMIGANSISGSLNRRSESSFLLSALILSANQSEKRLAIGLPLMRATDVVRKEREEASSDDEPTDDEGVSDLNRSLTCHRDLHLIPS
jgi:hypothetical protein